MAFGTVDEQKMERFESRGRFYSAVNSPRFRLHQVIAERIEHEGLELA